MESRSFLRFTAYFISLLISAGFHVSAQMVPQQDPESSYNRYNKSAATTVLVITGLFFTITGFLFVFLYHLLVGCVDRRLNNVPQRRAGFKPREIKAFFPAFVYGEVKMHSRKEKGELECAVCLSEYDDHEKLRMLPGCRHVFHTSCIDPWLASRVTCPVCRAEIEPVNHTKKSSVVRRRSTNHHLESNSEGDEIEEADTQLLDLRPLSPQQQQMQDDINLITQIRNSPEVRARFKTRGNLHRSRSAGYLMKLSSSPSPEGFDPFMLRLHNDPVGSGGDHATGSSNFRVLSSPRWGYRGGGQTTMVKGKNNVGTKWGQRFSMTPPFGIGGRGRSSPEPIELYTGRAKAMAAIPGHSSVLIKSMAHDKILTDAIDERLSDKVLLPDQMV